MSDATALPTPPAGRGAAEAWVRTHLGDLAADEVRGSPVFRGGQTAADAALAAFDVTGYGTARTTVEPPSARGASMLSPFIRHGLLPLPRVWDAVAGGPAGDVGRYRDELLWQEYARHLYARLGGALGAPLRAAAPDAEAHPDRNPAGLPWDPQMACMDLATTMLRRDGWVVNEARMWLASQWSVRHRRDWRAGEEAFFRHLLDGSRAANRLGWQWTAGTATGKRYGFRRWQVQRRAPGTCERCALRDACPVEDDPDAGLQTAWLRADPRLRRDPDTDPDRGATAGPREPLVKGEPAAVWLTAESLGDADPALAAHPHLPAVFVFDAPLLDRLRLSGKRLVFLAETLGDLATRRDVEVLRGDPVAVLADRPLAATFAPVPGWRRRAAALDVAATHPWPWLRRPAGEPLQSYTAWRRADPAPRP